MLRTRNFLKLDIQTKSSQYVKKERKGRRVEKVKGKSLHISPAERLWQYGLWSFQMGG